MTRVLLVDDESDLADLMANQLTRAGFDVTCADALLTAKAVGKDQTFDVLITDFNLHDGDGVDVARELKIPICLALTGNSGDADTKRMLGAGFVAVLVKPVTASRLVEAINSALAVG